MSPNGVIIGYNVTLSGVNLANSDVINISENSEIVTDTSYTVAHTSIPYSDYTAVVFASTIAGDSTDETVTVQTPEEGEWCHVYCTYATNNLKLLSYFSSYSRARASSGSQWHPLDCQLDGPDES